MTHGKGVCRDRSNRAAPYHFPACLNFTLLRPERNLKTGQVVFLPIPYKRLGESRKVTRLYQPPSFFVNALYPLCRCRPQTQALAERQSCVAPERRKMPHCGAGLVPAGRRRAAAPGRSSWALLNVALPCLLPHRSILGAVALLWAARNPPRDEGHQGFLFCKCQALLPLTRASPQGRSVAHLHNSPSTLCVSGKGSKQTPFPMPV